MPNTLQLLVQEQKYFVCAIFSQYSVATGLKISIFLLLLSPVPTVLPLLAQEQTNLVSTIIEQLLNSKLPSFQ